MHKGKKIKYYSLTSLKIITIGAMKLNVQTPSCMAPNCIMVRTRLPCILSNGTSVTILSSHVSKLHDAQYSSHLQLTGQLYPLLPNNKDSKTAK